MEPIIINGLITSFAFDLSEITILNTERYVLADDVARLRKLMSEGKVLKITIEEK